MVCPAFPKTQDAWPRGALPQGISGPHTLVSSETLETAGKMPTLPRRTAASPLLSSPNRTYISTGAGVKKINFIRVYDRWGELLFTRQNILAGTSPNVNGWDGTFRGRPVDAGVYVYLIEAEFEDGQKLLYRGDVTVVK